MEERVPPPTPPPPPVLREREGVALAQAVGVALSVAVKVASVPYAECVRVTLGEGEEVGERGGEGVTLSLG